MWHFFPYIDKGVFCSSFGKSYANHQWQRSSKIISSITNLISVIRRWFVLLPFKCSVFFLNTSCEPFSRWILGCSNTHNKPQQKMSCNSQRYERDELLFHLELPAGAWHTVVTVSGCVLCVTLIYTCIPLWVVYMHSHKSPLHCQINRSVRGPALG